MAGFADGFRSGFGLISDVKNRELQRDRLEEQARQGDLDRESTAAYRQAQTDNAAEQIRLAGERNITAQSEADSQALYRQGQIDIQKELNRIRALEAENKKTQLGLGQKKDDAMAGYYDSQSAAIKQKTDAENERLSNIEKEQKFAVAAQAFNDHVATGQSATARTPEWNARADELFQAANGGLLSPLAAVDPETKANGVAFMRVMTAMQNGEDADRDSITPIINTFIRSSNLRKVGAELTEQNTPNAGHLNGKGWKIIGKEVAPDWQVVNGMLTGTVDVTVQNAAGDITVYNAPLSSGRSGQQVDDDGIPLRNADGSSVAPVPLGISTDDLMKAAAGYFKYAQHMGQFEDEIYQSATRLHDFQNGAGDLAKKSNAFITNFQTKYAVGTMAGEQSPISGLTNVELASPEHFNKLERYAQHSVIDPSKNAIKPTGAAEKMIKMNANIPEVKELEDELGRSLTRSELLQAGQYFSDVKNENTGKTRIVMKREDKKPWELWKREVLGIVETSLSPNFNFDEYTD
jgi:hypothetical protein